MISLAQLTLRVRHSIVKLLAPRVYLEHIQTETERRQVTASAEVPRPVILFVRATRQDESLEGVEIGVNEGLNAESILSTLNMKTLHLVDPYIPYMQGQVPAQIEPSMKLRAAKRLEPFKDRTHFVYLPSEEAVGQIPDELDFVYIDGNHDYAHVRADIENYFRKVKQGGVVGGHDFHPHFAGLIRAVCEFAEARHLPITIRSADWWIVKDS
jgi:hypothetical protein